MEKRRRPSPQPSEQERLENQQSQGEASADTTLEETLHEKTTRDRKLGEIATKEDQRMLEEEAVEDGLGWAVYEPATEKTPKDTTPLLKMAGRFEGPDFVAIEGRAPLGLIYIKTRKSNRNKSKTRRHN
jgi:hypothetical protein